MAKRLDIKPGDRFGKLTVIEEAEPNITPCGTIQRKFLCVCDCGNKIIYSLPTLTRGAKQSCGCDFASWARKYTDEQKSSFLYSTWKGMRQRCYNTSSQNYVNYGGRGIIICDEWKDDYVSFYNWALNNGAEPKLSIDRIDVNGNYCPENCRWVDNQTQQRNRQYNRYIKYNGVRKLMKEWSEELNIPYDTIRARLDQHGYTVGQALGFEYYEPKTRPERPETRKPVLQYTMDGKLIREWASLIDIQSNLGISAKSIRSCCMGYTKSSHGFAWSYKDGVKRNRNHEEVSKPVLQYTLEGVFVAEYPDTRTASEQTGINASGIQKFCNNNKRAFRHCGGYIWQYKVSDNIPDSIIPIKYDGCSQHNRLEYNGESKTISEWAKEPGTRVTTIESRIKNGWEVGQALGFKHHIRRNSKYGGKILQYDKDMNLIKEWHSLHFIRKETGRTKVTILRYLKNGELYTHGYYWRYKED